MGDAQDHEDTKEGEEDLFGEEDFEGSEEGERAADCDPGMPQEPNGQRNCGPEPVPHAVLELV